MSDATSYLELTKDFRPPAGFPSPRFWGDRTSSLKPPPGYAKLGVRSEAGREAQQARARAYLSLRTRPMRPIVESMWRRMERSKRIEVWRRCEQLAFESESSALAHAVGRSMLVRKWNREYHRQIDPYVSAHEKAVGEEAAAQTFIRLHRLPYLAETYPVVRREIIRAEGELSIPIILSELRYLLG